MALENIPYNIHKVTLLSFEPEISAIQIKKIFGDDIEKQNILDIVIKKGEQDGSSLNMALVQKFI